MSICHLKKWLSLTMAILSLSSILFSCGDNHSITRPPDEVQCISAGITAWSPDGQWIAVAWYGDPSVTADGLYLVRPDGTDFHMLKTLSDTIRVITLDWSPDNNWLLLGAGQLYAWNDIFKMKLNGDSLTRLTYGGVNFEGVWAPSDTIIAFNHDISPDDSVNDHGLWLMDGNGRNQRLLLNKGVIFDFSLGDSLLCILGTGNDSGKMVMIDVATKNERLIRKWKTGVPYTTYYEPAASPDGNSAAFSIDCEICTVSLESGEIRQLTFDGGRHPSWSSDSRYIVYNKTGNNPQGGTIWIMKSDGTEKKCVISWEQLAKHDFNK